MAKKNVYAAITDNIVRFLEQDIIPWQKEWETGSHIMPINHTSNRIYTGPINILQLWATQTIFEYKHNRWLTFKAAEAMDLRVRKGEKGTLVTWTDFKDEKNEETGKTERRWWSVPYHVFNVAQVDGLAESIEDELTDYVHPVEDIALADRLPQALGVTRKEGEPSYSPTTDILRMPPTGRFKTANGYMATLAHECVHATGHHSRCNRDLTGRFGDEHYAMEELIAEIGAAFITAQWGLNNQLENHASYVKSWIKVLKNDNKAIFDAARMAKKATDYLEESLRLTDVEPQDSSLITNVA